MSGAYGFLPLKGALVSWSTRTRRRYEHDSVGEWRVRGTGSLYTARGRDSPKRTTRAGRGARNGQTRSRREYLAPCLLRSVYGTRGGDVPSIRCRTPRWAGRSLFGDLRPFTQRALKNAASCFERQPTAALHTAVARPLFALITNRQTLGILLPTDRAESVPHERNERRGNVPCLLMQGGCSFCTTTTLRKLDRLLRNWTRILTRNIP